MSKKTTAVAALKTELRINDYSWEPWEIAMSCFFDLCSHLYEIGDCPIEWGFRPGALGNQIDDQSYYYNLFMNMDDVRLTECGNYLFRLTNILQKTGRAY